MYKSPADVTTLPCDLDPSTLQPSDLSDLKASCVLTEKAKAFIVARQILSAENQEWAVIGGLQVASVVIADQLLTLAEILLRKVRFPGIRFAVFSIILSSVAYLCLFAITSYRQYQDKRADERAASLTPFYAAGAVEYYTKQLDRNKLLWKLTINEQKSTDKENVNNKTPSITELVERMKIFVKTLFQSVCLVLEKNKLLWQQSGKTDMYTDSGNVTNQNPAITERLAKAKSVVELWEKGELEVKTLYDRSKETEIIEPQMLRSGEILEDPEPTGI